MDFGREAYPRWSWNFMLKIMFIFHRPLRSLHSNYHIYGGVQPGPSHFFRYMQLEYMPQLQRKLDPLYPILPFILHP